MLGYLGGQGKYMLGYLIYVNKLLHQLLLNKHYKVNYFHS
jgi:hypothetical protein